MAASYSVGDQILDPSNVNNPLDSIGRLHNEGLSYIESKLESAYFTSEEQILDSIQKWTSNFVSLKGLQHSQSISNYSSEVELLTYSGVAQLLQIEEVSVDFLDALAAANSVVEDYPITEVADQIRILEGALNTSDLPANEQMVLNCFFSVLRHSSAYWAQCFDNLDSPWFNQNSPILGTY